MIPLFALLFLLLTFSYTSSWAMLRLCAIMYIYYSHLALPCGKADHSTNLVSNQFTLYVSDHGLVITFIRQILRNIELSNLSISLVYHPGDREHHTILIILPPPWSFRYLVYEITVNNRDYIDDASASWCFLFPPQQDAVATRFVLNWKRAFWS